MKGNMMNNEQLEFGLNQNILRITVRRARPARARWWFQQMRRAVDAAIDWRPQTSGRPEQIPLIPGRRPSLV